MVNGFLAIFDTYLLQAVTDPGHVSVILFTVSIFALVAMVERSGGTAAVMKALRQHSSKTRMAQFTLLTTGLIMFFDPYVSILFVGKVIGSIFEQFPLSSEKVSFLLDTTATPVASIFPKSTWFTFLADLIDREIENIAQFGYNEIDGTSGQSLVLSSIKYQFYPILILSLTALQILTGREMGPILRAENKSRLSFNICDHKDESLEMRKERSWNWYVPVVVLSAFLWATFSQVVFKDAAKYDSSLPPTTTWLVSAVATIMIAQLIFLFQRRSGTVPFLDGYFDRHERDDIAYLTDTFPSASGSASFPYNPSSRSEDTNDYLQTVENDHHKILQMNTEEEANGKEGRSYLGCSREPALLNLEDGIECLLRGVSSASQVCLSLTFAWATASVYKALGIDRVIILWVLDDGVSAEMLPVVIFFASFSLSLIVGSSWITTSILLPAIVSSLTDSLGGDPTSLALALASMISGAAAGDHIGPFSETTILSAAISGTEVRCHCLSQAPYAIFVLVVSIVFGTLPVSFGGYPSYVGYIVGLVVLNIFVIFVCRQVKRYQLVIGDQAHDQPFIHTAHSKITTREDVTRSEEQSGVPSPNPFIMVDDVTEGNRQHQQNNVAEFSVMHSLTEEGTEIVEMRNGKPSINLQSSTKKFDRISGEGGDPILGLVEDGLLPKNFRSEVQKPPLEEKDSKNINSECDVAKENKKRLIEATIKKAEEDRIAFSDSLRMFLRTAEQKLGNILENNESSEVSRSGSGESNGDDSLDNLMLNMASKGWRASINNILGDGNETVTSAGEDYTTDGGSSMMESDDSAAATTFSVGRNGPRTYYSGYGDITSCGSSTTGPSTYSIGTSLLVDPLDLEKSRQSFRGWKDNEDFSAPPDDFTANEYTQASF